MCSCLRGVSRWFTPLACGPGYPELSKSYMDMAALFAGYYNLKGRVSVVCVCYSLLLSSVCYTVVLRYSSMIM